MDQEMRSKEDEIKALRDEAGKDLQSKEEELKSMRGKLDDEVHAREQQMQSVIEGAKAQGARTPLCSCHNNPLQHMLPLVS